MANLVADIAARCNTKNVIDIGAGKGYLSTFLAAEYGLKVNFLHFSEYLTYRRAQADFISFTKF